MPTISRVIAGRFTIEKKLDNGGYGTVMRATDVVYRRLVALKVIPKIHDDGDKDESYEAELDALKTLGGLEYVPTFYASGAIEDHNYLVMELLEINLLELRNRNEDHAFKVPTALQLTKQLIHAMEGIHQEGFLHRDIKLPNLMLRKKGENWQLVVVDFGLAKRFKDATTGIRLNLKYCGLQFSGVDYSAPRASRNLPFYETEDLITCGYTALSMRQNLPWSDERDSYKMLEWKIDFGKNPEKHLRPCDKALAPIISKISNQVYKKTPDYKGIIDTIEMELQKYNTTSHLAVIEIDGVIRLE